KRLILQPLLFFCLSYLAICFLFILLVILTFDLNKIFASSFILIVLVNIVTTMKNKTPIHRCSIAYKTLKNMNIDGISKPLKCIIHKYLLVLFELLSKSMALSFCNSSS